MTGMTAAKNALMNVRRHLSQRFWKAWHNLPISQSDRAGVLRFVFKRLPFLVSWSASYRNWTADSAREAAQLAKIAEFRKAAESRPEGRSARYVDPSSLPRPDHLIARAIAFYLPQFHAIPENDRWWGKGFTEWTNVRRARPQFQGHRQPRRPGELGYYDLGRDASIRRRQAALAHQYGLEGFCFYFYWFGGKTLLEAPIKAWAQDDEIRFPFCLCWANESWSRRWDGREDQKLIVQYHSPEDDIAFIRHISDYLKTDKYLRIDGRPLIVVYRPDKLPDAQATAKRWREWCRQNGVGEIYLAYTLSFAEGTPQQYGFDAAIEFPPNNMGLPQHSGLVEPTSDEFAARVYDLQELALRSASHDKPRMKLFRGVAPQWDNTARRMHNAAIMLDGGPSTYELWLSNAARQTAEMHGNPDERLVFINAWNEWAEGAYLEPDLDRGYAWLEATRRALTPPAEQRIEPAELVPEEPMIVAPTRHKVIVVVHDLWRNGAQFLALNLVATYVMKFGCEVVTIACGDGPLAPNFEWYGRLIRVSQLTTPPEKLDEICRDLHKGGFSAAVVNSLASGWVTPHLAKAGIRCVGLVHEMPDIIRRMQLETGVRAFDEHAASIVFSSERLKQSTGQSILRGDWTRGTIIPQGLYKAESILSLDEKQAAAHDIRGRFGLPENAFIVLGVAYGDHRKGVDIFCKWAIAAARRDPKFHFLWVGDLSSDMQRAGGEILANSGDLAGNVHFTGFKHDIATFYKAAHAYALSSREDPFPSTVLDALACGTPAFVVDGTTGLTELKDCPAIRVLPDADPDTFADALAKLTSAPSKYRDAARSGIALIRERFGFTSYAGDVLRLAGKAQPRISVVVPNYNYARHLPHRIATILNQDQPVWEIIFLDDASTDDSLQVAERLLQDCGISYRIVPNKKNSGSVFAQWKKGVDLARGDIVWIAEADDWASARFTAVASEALLDPDVLVSYTQSNQVNAEGEIICPHYLDYVADIDRERWRRRYVSETGSEIDLGLAIKNTIPNVSGVLFRRSALSAVLEEHMREIRTYRVAGDWCCYLHLARRGRIAFDPRPLNYHRRHGDSVTVSRFTQAEFDEIAQLQRRAQALGDVSSESLCKSQAYLEALRGML